MGEKDLRALREGVRQASLLNPSSGEHDVDEFLTGSLLAAYNRVAPAELALPTEGRVALEVSTHTGGRLPAHESSRIEGAIARAVALVGAAIAHPDAEVGRLTAQTRDQALVYSRPTPSGIITFLPQRWASLPGMTNESIAERAMVRLANLLPENSQDSEVAFRMVTLRQPERRAVKEVVDAAVPEGLTMVLRGPEVVQSILTSAHAQDLEDFLADSRELVTPMPPMTGRLDGMRFRRQMFYLELDNGREIQGLVDEDMVAKTKELLDTRVVVALEQVTRHRSDGHRERPSYRLVGVEPERPDPTFFDDLS